jgi:hypothetical protein
MTKKILKGVGQHAVIAVMCVSMISMMACTVDEVLSSIDAALQTAQGLEAAVGAVSPADSAALQLLTGIGVAGVEAIQKAYDTYEKNKTPSAAQDVVVAAQAIQSNLPQELSALHITDAEAVSKATAWVNLMTDCATAIISEVNAVSGAKVSRSAGPYLLTPEAIQARWQSEVCKGDGKCGSLVKVHHKHANIKL